MGRNQSIKMRGESSHAAVYTLKMDAEGKAQLIDSDGASVWESDDEDDSEFHTQFGDFMEEDQADDLVDWLFNHVTLPPGAEIEVEVEYEEEEDDEEEDAEEDEDEDDADHY